MLGKSAKVQTNTILRQQREGHEIANHSWNHKYLSNLGTGEVSEQINQTNEAIKGITGTKVKYLRPPYVAMNSDESD